MDSHELILERDKTFWIATLQKPEEEPYEIWQAIHLEQDNPGYSSWYALRDFVAGFGPENETKIIGLRVRFRSHTERLPDNADGYYFKHGVIGELGYGREETINCYVVGYVENNHLYKTWYRVPEIISWQTETIPLDHQEPNLILNV